ncbi:MAG: hypothetical protein IPI18_19990 [Saprospiraceae bacterium]|nr:hypothetical protein [Saprospiraceae bacterium]
MILPGSDPYLGRMLQLNKYGVFLVHYIFELPLRILDVFGLPEIFNFFQRKLKPSSRELYEFESKLAQQIFASSLDLSQVRIDESSHVGTHNGKYAYVSFYYINCKGMLQLPILIHEIVHILQYEQDGSPYAFRNMIAHLMPPTYDYGGLETVQAIVESPNKVHDLNYEQRADIYSDYCLLLLGKRPEWGSATLQDAMQYYKVIKLLNQG